MPEHCPTKKREGFLQAYARAVCECTTTASSNIQKISHIPEEYYFIVFPPQHHLHINTKWSQPVNVQQDADTHRALTPACVPAPPVPVSSCVLVQLPPSSSSSCSPLTAHVSFSQGHPPCCTGYLLPLHTAAAISRLWEPCWQRPFPSAAPTARLPPAPGLFNNPFWWGDWQIFCLLESQRDIFTCTAWSQREDLADQLPGEGKATQTTH